MYQQLGAQDAQFIYSQTPTALTHVMAISVYDPATADGGRVELQDIVEQVRSRLYISPLFRRKLYHPPLNMDHPYWVEDEHFDLEAHITHSRLPAPGDWRQFAAQVSRHFSRPMDMNRPLWDMHVLEQLGNVEGFADDSYAIITRLHHSAIDGIGASRLFAALSDRDPQGTPAPPLDKANDALGYVPGTRQMLSRALRGTLGSPARMTSSLLKFTPEILSAARANRARDGKPVAEPAIPDTRFNGPVSPHKVFDALEYPLADFKAIKSALEGATINDAVLAVMGGALRLYLQHHQELPEQPLVGWCPVSARKKGGADSSAGNNLSGMKVPIGTNEADPLARLVAIRQSTASRKSAESGVGARMMIELPQHIPGPAMLGLARILSNQRFAPKFCNLFVSNVPGSPTALYMNGAKCTHQYGLAPLGNGMGLFIAVGSYDGKLVFNIISDQKILPDIAFFRQCIDDAFHSLYKATVKPSARKRVRDQ